MVQKQLKTAQVLVWWTISSNKIIGPYFSILRSKHPTTWACFSSFFSLRTRNKNCMEATIFNKTEPQRIPPKLSKLGEKCNLALSLSKRISGHHVHLISTLVIFSFGDTSRIEFIQKDWNQSNSLKKKTTTKFP